MIKILLEIVSKEVILGEGQPVSGSTFCVYKQVLKGAEGDGYIWTVERVMIRGCGYQTVMF